MRNSPTLGGEYVRLVDRLDDITPDLLAVGDLEISPHQSAEPGADAEGNTAVELVSLSITVGEGDVVTHGGAPLETQLGVHVVVEAVDLGSLGDVVQEGVPESAGPDGGGNRGTNGRSDAAEQIEDSHDDGNVLMVGRSHHGHLSGDDEGTSGKGNEDLAHGDVSDRLTGHAEVDHEADTKSHQGDRVVQVNPLESTSVSHGDGNEQRREAGTDTIDVADVGGDGNTGVEGDQAQRRKETTPDLGVHEDEGQGETGEEDGAIGQQAEGNKGNRSNPLLVGSKDEEQDRTDGEHGDDHGAVPLLLLERPDGQRQKGKSHAGSQDQDSDDVNLHEPLSDGLRGNVVLSLLDEAHLLGLALVVVEEDDEGRDDDGDNDGPDTVSPSPGLQVVDTISEENSISNRATDPGRHNVGRGGKGEHQRSVDEGRSIGNEDGDTVADSLSTTTELVLIQNISRLFQTLTQ